MAAVQALLSSLHDLAHGRFALRAPDGAVQGPREPPRPREGEYAHAGPEPLLEDLLHDPLVIRVMDADHVEPAQLRRLLGLRQRPVVL